MNRMTAFFAESEPVRRWLYGLAVPVVALLVLKGVLTQEEGIYYLTIGAAFLVVPVGVEAARARVTPVDRQS